jgi:hypothetical protein
MLSSLDTLVGRVIRAIQVPKETVLKIYSFRLYCTVHVHGTCTLFWQCKTVRLYCTLRYMASKNVKNSRLLVQFANSGGNACIGPYFAYVADLLYIRVMF